MTPHVDFSIFTATSVISAYRADTNPLFYPLFPSRTGNLISGNAPYFKVEFHNNSISASGYDSQEFIWHFGDYYAESTVIILSATTPVEHIYTMPGKYTVSLTLKQTSNNTLTKPINITTSKQIIELKELLPQARIHSVTQPVYGDSPLTLEFTPVHCIPGSFPLNRIDWDFGDGSPIKIITRQTIMSADPDIYFTDTVNWDVLDVRNYNVRHTYYRTSHENQIFYPSLTCYSSNTDLFDTCSTTIGPIFGSPTDASISLLKTRNTSYGNL
jgi:hypothetical protein